MLMVVVEVGWMISVFRGGEGFLLPLLNVEVMMMMTEVAGHIIIGLTVFGIRLRLLGCGRGSRAKNDSVKQGAGR